MPPAAALDDATDSFRASPCFCGTIEGFYFGTHEKDTGYHRFVTAVSGTSVGDPPVEPGCDLGVTDCSVHVDLDSSSNKQCRRIRGENGKRMRGKTRRWKAMQR